LYEEGGRSEEGGEGEEEGGEHSSSNSSSCSSWLIGGGLNSRSNTKQRRKGERRERQEGEEMVLDLIYEIWCPWSLLAIGQHQRLHPPIGGRRLRQGGRKGEAGERRERKEKGETYLHDVFLSCAIRPGTLNFQGPGLLGQERGQ
jgi:hypothetical protein